MSSPDAAEGEIADADVDEIVASIKELSSRPMDELRALMEAHEAKQRALLARVSSQRDALAALAWCDDFSRVRTTMLKLPEYKAKARARARARRRGRESDARARRCNVRARGCSR